MVSVYKKGSGAIFRLSRTKSGKAVHRAVLGKKYKTKASAQAALRRLSAKSGKKVSHRKGKKGAKKSAKKGKKGAKKGSSRPKACGYVIVKGRVVRVYKVLSKGKMRTFRLARRAGKVARVTVKLYFKTRAKAMAKLNKAKAPMSLRGIGKKRGRKVARGGVVATRSKKAKASLSAIYAKAGISAQKVPAIRLVAKRGTPSAALADAFLKAAGRKAMVPAGKLGAFRKRFLGDVSRIGKVVPPKKGRSNVYKHDAIPVLLEYSNGINKRTGKARKATVKRGLV